MFSQSLRRRCLANAVNSARSLHSTPHRRAVTKFTMPAMSPTMTEGGIASWKKKEGESFSSGDVLLEIETDKATIDVEAQENGVLGKIIAKDGERGLPVGKVIALLVDEGDDISNLEIPKEDEAPAAETSKPTREKQVDALPSPGPAPPKPSKSSSHIHVEGPVFPSVIRLLNEAGIDDYKKIKGTGVRGMLTKGDVLAYMGKASSPTGTYKNTTSAAPQAAALPPKKEIKPVDALSLRKMIVAGLSEISSTQLQPSTKAPTPTFDDIVNDYLPTSAKTTQPPILPSSTMPPPKKPDFLDGLI